LIASTGAGVRLFLQNDWQAAFSLAVPIRPATSVSERQDVRFLFSLSSFFKWCPLSSQWRCA
jgi:hypothetical protein